MGSNKDLDPHRKNDANPAKGGFVSEWLSKDTWFDAEQAVAVGLADEIAEPPPLPPLARLRRSAALAPKAESKEPTEQERFFQTCLAAFGKLSVCDKAAFGKRLAEWFQTSVRETD